MADVKVKFLRNYKVKDDEGKEFKEGKVYSMSPESAAHFEKRGAAVQVTGESKAKKEAPPPPPKND